MTEQQITMQQRRKTLRQFREEAGLSLDDIGKACDPPISRSTLSRFETGDRDLSEDAYNRVLEAIETFLKKKNKALQSEHDRLQADLAEARETAEKLGVTVALDLMGATLPGIKAMLESPSGLEATVKAIKAAEKEQARRKAVLRKVNTLPRGWLDHPDAQELMKELRTSYQRETDAKQREIDALKQQLQQLQARDSD